MKKIFYQIASLLFIVQLVACGGSGEGNNPESTNKAPTISGSPSSLVNVDSQYSFTPDAQDADGDVLTFSITNQPQWLTLDSSTGQLSGEPLLADVENYQNIRLTVTDTAGASSSLPLFDILVNQGPLLITDAQEFYLEGSDVTINGETSYDSEGHEFTYLWEQISGPDTLINQSSFSSIGFSAPLIDASISFAFRLTLTDVHGAKTVEEFTFDITEDILGAEIGEFVLLMSSKPTEVSLAWLAAIDNATPSDQLLYQLHFDKDSSFSPSASTLFETYTGETSAIIADLEPGTLYYFKLVVEDLAGNQQVQGVPAELSTVSIAAIRTNEIVNDVVELNLGTPQISGTNNETYLYTKNGNTISPEVGSFLVGEDESEAGYLRKVISVIDDQTTLTIETSQGSLFDVLQKGAISSKTHLKSVTEERSTTKKIINQPSFTSITGKTHSTLTWKDELLSISEKGPSALSRKHTPKQEDGALVSTQSVNSNPIEISASKGMTLTGSFFFEPLVNSNIEWDLLSVERYEADISGHFSFDGSVAFHFDGAASINDPKREVFSRTFTSKYILAGVAVYQETILSLHVKFDAVAETAMTASINNHLSAQVSFNTLYENGEWADTSSSDFNRSLTVTAQVHGNVSAEIRLIPEVKLRFYKVASTAMSVEPYLSGEIEAQAVTQTDLIDDGTLSEFSFTKFNSFVGVDVNFYTDLEIFDKTIVRYPEIGVINLYANKWRLFGLPSLEATFSGAPSVHNETSFLGTSIPFVDSGGGLNSLDQSSAEWAVFPGEAKGTGMSFLWQPESHGNIYDVYFIGNSTELGTLGKQYNSLEIDMRDSDADGMPNAWEAYYAFDINSPSDAQGDPDEDGVTNLDEYIANTNPLELFCGDIHTPGLDRWTTLGGDIGEYTSETSSRTFNGYDESIPYYTARQSADNIWRGYLNTAEGYIDDVLRIKETSEATMEDGCWMSLPTLRSLYYDTGIIQETRELIAFPADDDFDWWLIYPGGITQYFSENGTLGAESTFITLKTGPNSFETLKHGPGKTYYVSGSIYTEYTDEAIENTDGTWSQIRTGLFKSYFESGNLRSETSSIAMQNTAGNWNSVSSSNLSEYYETGEIKLVTEFHTYQTEQGYWTSMPSKDTAYFLNGNVESVIPYQTDTFFSRIKHGLVSYYFESGPLGSTQLYDNGELIETCTYFLDGSPTFCTIH